VALYTVASLLCAVSTDIWVLIALRLLQGLAGAAGIVLARAMVRDLFDGARAARAFSTLVVVGGLTPVVAPILGGQLTRVTDWRGMFVALVIVGAGLFAAALALPETLPPAARRAAGTRTIADFVAVSRDGSFLAFAAMLGAASCALFSYITLSPFVLQHGYGLTAQAFSLVFALNSLGILGAGYINGALVARVAMERLLLGGILLALVGATTAIVAVLSGGGVLVLLPGLFLAVSSFGIIMPNATAQAMRGARSRAGSASALLG
jgi:DHA1 family bicyclomycin/chloramphenicol resistance-like MFS transporter